MRPWLIAAAVATAACGAQAPTAPASYDHSGPPPPQMQCGLPAGSVPAPQAPAGTLACTLQAWNGKAWVDVTAQAEWSTSDPAIGQVMSPGYIRAVSRGIVRVTAVYASLTVRGWPYSYLLDPAAPTITLSTLTGNVLEDVPGYPKPLIGDVQIEIIEGTHNIGRTATTIANGAFSMPDFWMNEPFTARASKAGYESLTIACAGVPSYGGFGCSGPNLSPNAQSLNFFLKRQQP